MIKMRYVDKIEFSFLLGPKKISKNYIQQFVCGMTYSQRYGTIIEDKFLDFCLNSILKTVTITKLENI